MTKVIAHRGIRKELPENTCESIQTAIQLPGIFGVEFDVELSDFPLALHQESMVPNATFTALESATRDYQTRDWVGEHSSEAIRKLDAGSWLNPAFSSIKIPLLSDVFSLEWSKACMFMELKDPGYWSDPDPKRPAAIVTAISPSVENFKGPLEVISFNPEILKEMKAKFPHTPRILALWLEWQEKPKEAVSTALNAGASTISIADKMVLSKPEWITEIQAAGLKAHVYPISPTIEEPEYTNWNAESRRPIWKSLLELNVDALVSDFPRELLAMIKTLER